MILNSQMKTNRFLKWQNARKKLEFITNNLTQGKTVEIHSQTKRIQCKYKHIELFKATKNGLYMLNGTKYLNIDYNQLTAH